MRSFSYPVSYFINFSFENLSWHIISTLLRTTNCKITCRSWITWSTWKSIKNSIFIKLNTIVSIVKYNGYVLPSIQICSYCILTLYKYSSAINSYKSIPSSIFNTHNLSPTAINISRINPSFPSCGY